MAIYGAHGHWVRREAECDLEGCNIISPGQRRLVPEIGFLPAGTLTVTVAYMTKNHTWIRKFWHPQCWLLGLYIWADRNPYVPKEGGTGRKPSGLSEYQKAQRRSLSTMWNMYMLKRTKISNSSMPYRDIEPILAKMDSTRGADLKRRMIATGAPVPKSWGEPAKTRRRLN